MRRKACSPATSARSRSASARSPARSARCAAARRACRTRSTRGARSSRACRPAIKSSTTGFVRLRRKLQRAQGVLAARLVDDLQGRPAGHAVGDPRVRRLQRPAGPRGLHEADRPAGLGDRRQGPRAEEEVRAEAAAAVGPEVAGRRGREGDRGEAARAAGGALGDPEQRGGSVGGTPLQVRQAGQRQGAPPGAGGRPAPAAGRVRAGDRTSCRARAPRPPARSGRAAEATSGP